MPRLAYVNGRYLPHAEARVHVEDRGYQFADGVYEVVAVVDGRYADFEGHMARLGRSLGELAIDWPVARPVLERIIRELVRRNGVSNGLVYLQVTRGVAPRDFKFPRPKARPALVITTKKLTHFTAPSLLETGVGIITIPDIRWLRRDIKSVGLLPQALGKEKAAAAGCFEAWMVDGDGLVTEGCSSNAWIVTAAGTLVTRQADNLILNGITRLSLLHLAAGFGIPTEVRAFTVAEALAAREAFLSSASTFALPITRIDGHPVADGRPGAVALKLRAAYLAAVAGGAP